MSTRAREVDQARTEWLTFLELIPVVDDLPAGYLFIRDYAQRITHLTPNNLKKAILAGRIPRTSLIVLATEKRRRAAVHWGSTAYNFIVARSRKYWPKNFKPTSARSYRPLAEEGEPDGPVLTPAELGIAPPMTGTTRQSTLAGMHYRDVVDEATAKYRIQQLKIEKLQAEINLANNDVLKVEDVEDTQREIATELRGELKKMVQRVSSRLVAAKSVNMVREILEDAIHDALETLKNDDAG
jgi:hypothetical protein